MSVNFTKFDGLGRMLGSGSCPKDILNLQAQVGERVIEGEYAPLSVWLDPLGNVKPRTATSATLSGNVISGITLPARAIINNVCHELTSPTLPCTFSYAGSYDVIIDPVSELPKTFTVIQP